MRSRRTLPERRDFLAGFDSVGESPQSQRLDAGYGRGTSRAIGHCAGQVWDFRQPAPVGFSLYLHTRSSLSSVRDTTRLFTQ